MTGLSLAHYRIDAELGRGGMGIVYKATDTKLNRTVALKVLPAAALASEDDRARFFREAQAAAQLHHPNIATVFQIDEAIPVGEDGETVGATDGPRPFIAMEFVEGETVADLIKKGPFPLSQAVSIAGQVAEALKEAHGKDVVHRDIKSANVMLTPDGIAKVLDFGLAKTNQSTMLTRMGSTLGTVAYMSPEQARGQEVDGRTDLYALGTMLYEMVAGRLPFSGDYEQAVLYSILNEPAEPLTALRTGVPMDMERVVSKLLSKEAEYRYQSAAGLLADLKSLDLTGSGHSRRSIPVSGTVAEPARKAVLPIWIWGVVAGAMLVGGAGAWLAKPTPPREVAYLTVDLPDVSQPLRASWSPDGRHLYYVARDTTAGQRAQDIRRYDMAEGRVVSIEGTEDARSVQIGPEGRWLYLMRDGRIERMLTSGGRPTVISGSETRWPQFAVGQNEEVYFTTNDFGLASASLETGRAIVSERDSTGITWWNPVTGPRGDRLFWNASTAPGVTNGSFARLGAEGTPESVLPGHIVMALSSTGYAIVRSIEAGDPAAIVPFNAGTGTMLSTPVPVDQMGHLALSANGHLIYEREYDLNIEGETVSRIAADGSARIVGAVPGSSRDFATAQQREGLIMESRIAEPGRELERDLFLFDLPSGTQTRLTRDGDNYDPDWSPDDVWIYFTRIPDATSQVIARKRADGVGAIETVIADSFPNGNPTVSPDGSLIAYTSQRPGTDWDLYGYRVDSGESFVISDAKGAQSDAHFSPDGRHIVFRSGGGYNGAILVVPVDGIGEVEVAPAGGFPVWSADGGFIYYMTGRREIRRTPVNTDPVFRIAGSAELVLALQADHLHFDLLADGELIVSHPGSQIRDQAPEIRLILNFDILMEQLAPR